MKLSTLNVILGAFAALGAAKPAMAHKAVVNHTHCVLAGEGIAVDGNTDAQRKLSCGKIKGAVWDGTTPVTIARTAADVEKALGR